MAKPSLYSASILTRVKEGYLVWMNISPNYRILEEVGPDHDKTYTSGVFLNGDKVSSGSGRSKQEAEKDAAQKTLETLNVSY